MSATTIEIPNAAELLITVSGKNLLLPDDWNLVVDASAASVFSADSSTKTITTKTSNLKAGEKFSAIKTPTGLVTVSGGAELELGYEDSTGINKFVHLDWGDSIAHNVSIKNITSNTDVEANQLATQVYKDHFLAPTADTTPEVEARVEDQNGYLLYNEPIGYGFCQNIYFGKVCARSWD